MLPRQEEPSLTGPQAEGKQQGLLFKLGQMQFFHPDFPAQQGLLPFIK